MSTLMIKRYRHSIFKSYFVYLASFTMRDGPRVASTQQHIKMSSMLYGWIYDAFVLNAPTSVWEGKTSLRMLKRVPIFSNRDRACAAVWRRVGGTWRLLLPVRDEQGRGPAVCAGRVRQPGGLAAPRVLSGWPGRYSAGLSNPSCSACSLRMTW